MDIDYLALPYTMHNNKLNLKIIYLPNNTLNDTETSRIVSFYTMVILTVVPK